MLPNPLLWLLGFKPTNTLVRTQFDYYIMTLYINYLYNSKCTMDFRMIMCKLLIFKYSHSEFCCPFPAPPRLMPPAVLRRNQNFVFPAQDHIFVLGK